MRPAEAEKAVASLPGYVSLVQAFLAVGLALSAAALGESPMAGVADENTRGVPVAGLVAAGAAMSLPSGVAISATGDLVFADRGNHRIRKVAARTGVITTVAGTGVQGSGGDDGEATTAELNAPAGVAVNAAGDLFFADQGNHRIRKVAAATGLITTVAGVGARGFGGDGGPATSAYLNFPAGLALNAAGDLFFADQGNHRIRKVAVATGLITTVAGTGVRGFGGDGGPATSAKLNGPHGITVDPNEDIHFTDRGNHRIRKVAVATGLITTVAGTGVRGFGGDGGPATSAEFNFPTGLSLDWSGNLFVADRDNHRIRKVASTTGLITTVAGTGVPALWGDGGSIPAGQLTAPSDVAVSANGTLFIADMLNNRILGYAGVASAARPRITAPAAESVLTKASASPTKFAWTGVQGAVQYGFEHTGPGRQFGNPNGTEADSVNGFGGTGGGFMVSGTSFPAILRPSTLPGTYQVRVIGLSATGFVVGTFSDALTVVVR